MKPQHPRCSYVSPNGRPCLAYAVKGSTHCFFHDPSPEAVAKRKRSLMRGAKKTPADDGVVTWDTHPIATVADLKVALSELFNAGMSGAITTARLSSLASVANALSKVIEQSDLEKRIKTLEERMEQTEVRK